MTQQVSLVGLGLIGGSLGKGLRRVKRGSKRVYRVTGWGRSAAKLKKAKSLGAIDLFSTNLKHAVSNADIVVISVPVQGIPLLTKLILPHLKKGAVLTDVGSVKQSIIDSVRPFLKKRKDVFFVGGHPVAGSEKTGVENAHHDLFKGAHCVLTKDLTKPKARQKIEKLWSSVGMKCVLMSAKDHDRALAITSHLPHLLSFSLKKLALQEARKNSKLLSLVGGSFRDMTRVANSDPDLWKGIFRMNKKELRKATLKYRSLLKRFPLPDRRG